MGTEPARLRVMLAALNCQPGGWTANLAAHREVLRLARDQGCHLAVFPEMSLSGSVDSGAGPGPLLGLESRPVQSLVEATQQYPVAAVFGLAEQGRDGACHITQAYAAQGRLAGVYRKRHLGEGEEGYTPGTEQALFQFGAVRFGIAICAEGKVDYPFDEPVAAGAEVIFFRAAPGLYGRRTDEESWRAGHAWWQADGLGAARRHAARTGAWVAMATQAGSARDEDFPGLAALVAPTGEVVARLPGWRPGTLVVDLPLSVVVEPVREAARVLVMDGAGRTLLVRFCDDVGLSWWTAPGGGLEPGEDHLTAARRELAEELGRDNIEIGPQVGWRSDTMRFAGGPWMTQRERWFLARCRSFEVAAGQLAKLAAERVAEVRWWSATDLASAGVVTAPRRLAGLVADVGSGRIPPPGTDLGV